MIEESRRHRDRALRFLTMVESRWQLELPEVVAHTAYYAMYHAAVALFAKRDLPLPKTHAGLISRVGEIFRDVKPNGGEQVGRLRRAFDRRLIGDYDAVDTLTVEDARAARDEAVAFIAFCERLIDTE